MKHFSTLMIAVLVMSIGIANAQITRVNEDFNTSLTPSGWSNSLNTGPLIGRVTSVQSFGRPGTIAAVLSDNYNVTGGSRAQLETPLFTTPTVLGDSLRFDVAHATYTGGEHDSLILLAFDGVSFNRIAAWGSSPTIDLTGITTAAAQTAEFIPTSAQWLTKSIALPVGSSRVRFEFYSDFGNQLYIDKVIVDSFYSVTQVYSSSTTTQTNVSPLLLGTTNQEVIGIEVVTSGNNPALPLTSFNFNTGASTNAVGDITNAKVYYTGLSSTFSTTNLFGSLAAPNGAFTITGSIPLLDGNNHFWLAYDISTTASNGNIIDATCTGVTVDAIVRTPTVQNPAGSRVINAPNQVAVTASAGVAGAVYSTLKEAFDKINDGTHQGNITINIANSTTETASAILRRSGVGLASYTRVYIAPTAPVTVTGNIAGSLVHLKGAQNVTIDGRIGMVGTNQLSFENTNSATNTAVIQLSSMGSGLGSTMDTISYCNIKAGGFANALSTFGIYIADSTISNTATGLNNNYIGIVGNKIEKCRYGIYNRGSATSSATYNKSIFINGNTLGSRLDSLTISFVGIDCRNNDSLTISNNNIVGMVEYGQTAILRAMELGGNIINSKINANFIDNVRNATTTLFRSGQGIFISTVTASNNIISNNVIQNLNGHGSSTFTNNVWGIFVSAGGGIKILFNTIALTGVGTATGSTDRSGCLLLNSSASTAIEVRGNIFFNTRSPGNATAGFSEAVHSLTTAVNLNINRNIYYVTPSNARFLVGVLGGDRATLANWQTATTQDVNSLDANPFIAATTLGRSRIAVSSPAIGAGPTGTGIVTDILQLTRTATPSIGAYETGATIADLTPTNIYTLGKLPIPYANPHTLRASIANLGNDTAFGSKAYITVSGANSILDSIIMPAIAPGSFISVNMPSYSYINLGIDTVTISVESDSNNSNNSINLVQIINSNTYSYAEPFRPSDGGVGFTGATGDFVAKFPYTGFNSINQIGVNFNTGGQTLSVGIWDTSATGGPGVNLWTSAPFVTAAGLNTIVVNPPIPVTGSFFVGVRQTGTVNSAFSFQQENPIRAGTFFYTSPTGSTTWTDFAPGSPFRFMIEPRLQDPNDLGVESISQPCLSVVQGSPAINPIIRVFNYGANPQTSFIVQSQITGPVNYSSSDTFNSVFLQNGESINLSLASTFNPNIVGVYTMKAWTVLSTDLQSNNDTATYQFSVTDANGFTNSGNQLSMDGTTQYGVVNGSGSLNITGTQLTLEGWINKNSTGIRNIISKDSASGNHQYSLYLNGTDNLVFKLQTINGTDSLVSSAFVPLLTFTHIAATFDGATGETKLYINGEVVGTKFIFGSIIGNTQPLYIGKDFNTTSTLFGGGIDELKIWDTCRTEDQIRSNMHTRLGNFAHPNLQAYWRMDEGSGTSLVDASGHCNAVSLVSNPLFTTSTIPLGAPSLYNALISISGTTPFPGSTISMNLYNQLGTNTIYIHRFGGTPIGTQPTGVTVVSPNTWMIYRYGTGTMDSAEVEFTTYGITATADPNDFLLFSRGVGSNGAWSTTRTANAANSTTGVVTFGLVASNFVNQFTIGANNNPLPVALIYFNADANNADVNLRWATASETDNAGFHIERSLDGQTFNEIAFVKGNGNSFSQRNYGKLDKDAFKSTGVSKLYYRLVQTDFSGKKEISKTAVVYARKSVDNAIAIYPNPFTSEIGIDIDAMNDAQSSITVSDITGKTVLSTSAMLAKGFNSIQTNGLSSLAKGIYFVQITINGEIVTHKLVKQ
jgi:hypothetical protein